MSAHDDPMRALVRRAYAATAEPSGFDRLAGLRDLGTRAATPLRSVDLITVTSARTFTATPHEDRAAGFGRPAVNFEEFVRQAMPGLLRYGYALTGNPHDAADLVQTTLEELGAWWSRLPEHGEDPLSYTRRLMSTTNTSRWRRSRREIPVAEIAEIAETATRADDPLEQGPLWRALGELPRRQRTVIVLRHYDLLSDAEIATILNISESRVKSQADRAMSALRATLAADCGARGTTRDG